MKKLDALKEKLRFIMAECLKVIKKERKVSDVKHYIVGHYRMWLMDNYPHLVRRHIKEQAGYRLKKIKKSSLDCYNQGSCVNCGCDIEPMVYSNKICENKCYDKLYGKKEWKAYLLNLIVEDFINNLNKEENV